MEEPKRHYKYITIPIEIFDNEELTPLEKFIFALIDVLDTPDKGCYARNDYIAQKCMCTERSVSSAISHLCKLGYIKVASFNGRDRILRSLIKPVRVEEFAEQNRKIFYADSQNFPSHNNNKNNNINTNINTNNTTPYIPQGGLDSELSRSELIFEEFRKFYKGTKRGLKTEFENFKKKHKDWKEVLPTLLEKYKAQQEAKEKNKQNGGFVPQEKNLQTYLNQRCWEEEINTTNELAKYGTISTQQTGTSEKPHERVLREMLEFTRNNVPELC